MYTLILNGQPDDKATALIQEIFNHGWTTGPLLFENAVKCQLQNMLLGAQSQAYNYIVVNGQAGFEYNTSIPNLVNYQSQRGAGFFTPIAGPAFVNLSKLRKYHDTQ
ncbi:hypothetical protein Q9189_007527 [Teloschistes chrysophthalmus]